MDARWHWLVVLVALASACTTQPARYAPTAEEQLRAWLAEAPREIVVNPSQELPAANVRVWDSRPAERVAAGVGGAAVGAVYTVAAGCGGGPAGCIVGAVFAPVGAVAGGLAGAISVKSVVNYHALAEAHGAPELYAAAVDAQLPARLASAVVAESREYFDSRKASDDPGPIDLRVPRTVLGGKTGSLIWFTRPHTRHTLRVGEKPATGQGELALSVSTLDLVGDVGDDPRVALVMEVRFRLASGEARMDWGGFGYEGSSRRVSEWRKNDAAAFREELDKAMRAIAKEAVARF